MANDRASVEALGRGLAAALADSGYVRPGATVEVRRHPSDWQTATYRMDDVSGLHWASMSGGVGRGTSRPAVFGYVLCDALLCGELAHSCAHGPPPHRILVCLPKKLNAKRWPSILERINPR